MVGNRSNRSLSKFDVVTPKVRRQQTFIDKALESFGENGSIGKNGSIGNNGNSGKIPAVTEKKMLPSVQEDTDDESHKNKLIRRQKMVVKSKSPAQDEFENGFVNTANGNLKHILKRVQTFHGPVSDIFQSKSKVVARHSEIIQGNSIARNLNCVNEKHANLFSQFIYHIVIVRLTEFREQIEGQKNDYK